MKEKATNRLCAYESPTVEIVSLVEDVIRTSDVWIEEPDYPVIPMDFVG